MNTDDKWYKDIYGIGSKTAEDMRKKLEFHGIPHYGSTAEAAR